MGMFVRVYYSGRYKDISLHELHALSIGSGKEDYFRIDNADLGAGHIRITEKNGLYSVQCSGTVYLNGAVIKNTVLEPTQIFILSKRYKISMLVIKEYQDAVVVPLSGAKELSIGRKAENNIVLSNPIVSGDHAKVLKKDSAYYIQDQASMNGTYVNAKSVKETVLKDGDEIIIGACKIICKSDELWLFGDTSKIAIHGINAPKSKPQKEGNILFKRSPRLKLEVPTGDIEIQSPPPIGAKPEMDKLAMILPLISTLVLAIVMTVISGSPMMLIFSAPMHIISGFMSFRNYKKQSGKFAEQEQLRLDKYNEHLESIIEEIESKREEQITALSSANPTVQSCINIVKNVERRLWERRPSDSDFMTVRVGSGTKELSVQIKTPRSKLTLEEDSLAQKAEEIYEKYKEVENLPITCSILKWSTCGIVGNRAEAIRLVENMVTQVVTHHCYTEVKLVVVFDENESDALNWMKNLPHAYDDERTSCYVATNKKEAGDLFNRLESEFKERARENSDSDYGKPTLKLPYYLFVISAPDFIEKETIRKYLYRNDSNLGVGTIMLFDELDALPKECNLIIEAQKGKGVVYSKDRASQQEQFWFESISEKELKAFANKMKTIYCNDTSADAEITDKITLFEVLNIKSVYDLDLAKRWKESNAMKTLTAPIGVKEKNALVYLDLHEDAHGSHGLVAGTTGSGKSETLQTYVLSMATLYHPYEVGFVIIDFKGGGMANQFENLPHLIGAITDMDGKEVNRSLLSIRAELDKRKRLFAENDVNKIDQYIELFRNGKVKTPLPHLIIIVDEFAELKADQPEFMQELVSAARVGRSLGVHLILATQKPAGQVSDQIWSNSNFKLCLKVRDESDSKEVLKSPLAAKIKKTGRGYLKVGNDEIFDLFQSGFSGAKVQAKDGTTTTELKEIVSYIDQYCKEAGIDRLQPICLPSLPNRIPYSPDFVKKNIVESRIPLGIFDHPAQQEQGLAYMDMDQNTFILGSAQTGKTNILQSLIRSLSIRYSPNEVNIYIMDFASMTLKTFERLNHVGGVVLSDEEEKLKNLFKLLIKELDQRKKRTTEVGVSSFAAYLDGGYKDMPRIVLILDNFSVYKELYGEVYETAFLRLCREGLTYGITVIVTNTATSGFGYKYLSLFADRLAFTCNDTTEYSNVLDRCRTEPSNHPGRALVKRDDDILEAQMFLAFEGEKEIERSAAAKRHIEEMNSIYSGTVAKQIPCIPDVLTREYIENNYPEQLNRYEYIIGLDYSSVDTVVLHLEKMSELSIVGKAQEDKLRIVNGLLAQIADDILDSVVQMTVIDSIERPLKKYSEMSFVSKYTIDYSEIGTVVDDLYEAVEERYSVLVNDSIEALDSYPLIAVIINNRDTLEYMSTTKDVCEKYKQIMKKAKALKILFVFSDIENAAASFGAPELLKRQKDVRNAFLTDNLKEIQFYDIAPNVARNSKELQEGDVYYMCDSNVQRIKLVEE